MKLKPHRYRASTLAAVALLAFGAQAAAATAYRWTDADGVVHYEQVPPGNGRPYQTITPNPLPATPAPAGPVSDNGVKAFLKRAEEDDARRAKARETAATEKAALASQCADARKKLQFLDERPPNRLRERGDNGEVRRMDANDWEAQRKAAGDIIAKTCKPA